MTDCSGELTGGREAPWSQAFLAYLSAGELRIARCGATGLILDYSALDRRGPEAPPVEWVGASGTARLYSFVVYRRQYDFGFPAPYNVSIAQLEEGPRLITTVNANPDDLVVGIPLRAAFDPSGRLVFEPTLSAAAS